MLIGVTGKAEMEQGRAWHSRFSFCGRGLELLVMVALRLRAAFQHRLEDW